jgi:hypothetical protein
MVPATAAAGIYSISVNTHDISGAPAHTLPITLTVSQDFSITSATGSETIVPSQTSSPYNLTIQLSGASFHSAVTLSCPSGLAAGAHCIFSPSTPIMTGSNSAAVVMSISTTTSASLQRPGNRSPIFLAIWLAFSGDRGDLRNGLRCLSTPPWGAGPSCNAARAIADLLRWWEQRRRLRRWRWTAAHQICRHHSGDLRQRGRLARS